MSGKTLDSGDPTPLRVASIVAALAAIVSLGVFFTRADAQTASATPVAVARGPRVVETARVARRASTHELRLRGVVAPVERARVAFTVGGRLEERRVGIGDRVRAGDLVARVDPRGFRNAARAAEASLDAATAQRAQLERDRARFTRLAASGAATSRQLEEIETGLDDVSARTRAAAVSVGESRREMNETFLRAPFDGVVTDVFVEEGELVGVGKPIVAIAGEDAYEIVVEATADFAHHVQVGDAATVLFEGAHLGDPLAEDETHGTVRAVVESATGRGGLHPIVVDIAGAAGVRAGAGADVLLRVAGRESTFVPLRALLDPSGQAPYVYRVRDNVAERVPVRLGELVGESVSVVGDLDAGDRVVVAGQARLVSGEAVEVRP